MPIYVQPGQTFEAAAQNLIPDMEGTVRAGIWTKPTNGTAVYGPSTAGITEDPAGSGFYGKSNFVAPDTGGQYWLIWDSGVGTSPAPDELVVAYTNPATVTGPTFATAADVALRLGRDLTDSEGDQVDFLLLMVTDSILAAVGKTPEWAAGLDVPLLLRGLTVEKVCSAFSAPAGVSGDREQLGQYAYSRSFAGGVDGGAFGLTKTEELAARRAVWGATTATAKMGSVYDDDVVSAVWPGDEIAW